jgi:DivIVA domain-containing protein
MEMTPQRVRSAEFRTVRKGADPDEVKGFLNDVADELERAQNQSTAMEARARAAVARLQEVSESDSVPAAPAVEASVEETETISRTLLLAQRTADNAVAEARGEAARIIAGANDEAATTLDSTREMSAQMLAEARAEARQIGAAERAAVASEVEALKARRDFLESDVEQLELFLTEQRSRVRDAATSLIDITERVPGGLGEARPPLLSASDDDSDVLADGADAELPETAPSDDDLLIVTEIADEESTDAAPTDESDTPGDETDTAGNAADSWAGADAPTQATPAVDSSSSNQPDSGAAGDEFRFSFDDDRR